MPIVLNGNGPVAGVTSLNTTVSDVELGFLDGVTSAIQTQINTAGGLVKITDSTFSAASSVSINNCFTSTYGNYLVVCTATSTSGAVSVRLRMRVGGVDASGANTYRTQQIYVSGSSSVVGGYALSTDASIIECGTDGGGGSLDIFRPQDAVYTFMNGKYNISTATVFNSHAHLVATAYDGFTIFTSSSTITGTVRVYGYRN